jgi:multidrug efflux system membrane fusion protein
MIKQNATSESDVENWRAQRDGARAAVDQANANLEIAQINLGYTRIVAPFDGRIGRRQVDPGNLVGPGGTTQLATIDQLAPIYVYFNVNEQEVLRLRAGLRAAGKTLKDVEPIKLGIGLQNETGYPHEATLDFVATDVDQSTGTLQARGVIPNQDYVFLPGLFVRVEIPVGTTPNALLVPDRAVGVDQRGHYLLVVGQDDVVEQQTVQIGALNNGMRVIEQGLSADDRVVIDGLQRAIPGSKVTPREVASSAEPATAATTPAKPGTAPAAPAATDATPAAAPSAPREPAAQP